MNKKTIKIVSIFIFILLVGILIRVYLFSANTTELSNITFENKDLITEKLNTFTENTIAKKNALTTNYRCKSQVVDYIFSEEEATKGLIKIFYYSSCFGYRMEENKIVEGSSFSNLLTYVEIAGTNANTLPITKNFSFDFPTEAYTTQKSVKFISDGLDILSRFKLDKNNSLYEQAKKEIVGT